MAKVCQVGHEQIVLNMVAAAASPSDHVLRLLFVARIVQDGGTAAIALIYPYMDCALRSWCQPGFRQVAPQEFRHIAWSMVLGIAYLHNQGLVHSEINPDRVLLNGSGIGEHAAANASMLSQTLQVCISGFSCLGS